MLMNATMFLKSVKWPASTHMEALSVDAELGTVWKTMDGPALTSMNARRRRVTVNRFAPTLWEATRADVRQATTSTTRLETLANKLKNLSVLAGTLTALKAVSQALTLQLTSLLCSAFVLLASTTLRKTDQNAETTTSVRTRRIPAASAATTTAEDSPVLVTMVIILLKTQLRAYHAPMGLMGQAVCIGVDVVAKGWIVTM